MSHDIVELSSDRGFLAAGLGQEESVVSYQESLDPPTYASRGDESAAGIIVFYYRGHRFEFPRTHTVSVDDALEALRLFLVLGRRPENIEWEEV
jgi:Immunity protein Imm1